MGRSSKYEGGSKIVPFRLPLKRLTEAKRGIEQYLKRFETTRRPKSENLYPLLPEDCIDPKKGLKVDKEWNEALLNANFLGSLERIPINQIPLKKGIPADLKEKLKKIDPNIVIPGKN